MKKYCLIIPANVCFCPYLSIYTKLFDKIGATYDIISWNRTGREEDVIQYNNFVNKRRNRLITLWQYLKFARFVKRKIIKGNYEGLVVFTSQVAIFLAPFLKTKYKKKYIVDYRDLSIEQLPIFNMVYRSILINSYANFISSPGFKQHLPTKVEYQLSHNFDIEKVKECIFTNCIQADLSDVQILTIGAIRDFISNAELIKSLNNKEEFQLSFVGDGFAVPALKEYAERICCGNITFEGYYPKEEEEKYVKSCTIMNIYFPNIKSHNTALSNRFYNSLIYKKPMIVTRGGIQGDYVEHYNLGIVIDNCENVDVKLKSFLASFSAKEFSANCNELLLSFLEDYKIFEHKIMNFVLGT